MFEELQRTYLLINVVKKKKRLHSHKNHLRERITENKFSLFFQQSLTRTAVIQQNMCPWMGNFFKKTKFYLFSVCTKVGEGGTSEKARFSTTRTLLSLFKADLGAVTHD